MHIEGMLRRKLTLTTRLGFLLGALCLLMLTSPTTRAQSYGTASGAPPFVAPEPVELGFTDSANGNLHLEISMGSYPQRANKQPLDIKFVYDSSSIWTIACGQFSCSWWSPYQTTSVWRLSTALVSGLAGINCGQNGACPEAVYQDQWGTSRYFPLQNTTCPIPTAYASDSSGYQVNWCQGKVYAPDGTLVESAGQAYEDTNGNFLSVGANQTFDTLGRTMPNGGAGSTCGEGGTGTQTCRLPNSQGGVSTYTITTTTIPVQTEFGQSSVGEFAGSLVVPESIALPDGTSYQFKYDCDSTKGNSACGSPGGQNGYYGLLTSVTLPTGGTVSYGYTKFNDSYSNKMEWFSSRTSASGTWTYSPQVVSTCSSTQVGCQQKVTVTKPSGDSTIYTFTLNNGAWPVQVQSYGGGSLLSTVTNTYDFSNACPFTGCHGASYIRLLTTQTSLPVPGGGNITKQTQYTYDSPQTGNITAAKEWRYYSGSFPSTPDRETDTTYLSTGTNDIDKPLNVVTRNSSSSMVAQTVYSYDSYSGSCPGGGLGSMTGVINHDDTNFGSAYTARGNPTQIQKWVSGSTYLTTQFCYDTTGQVTEQIDPAGNITGYGYADNFYNDNGSNPPASYTPNQKTNAYVTSVTPPIIGTAHIGYYYGSGNQAVLTDQNGATTYDHFMDPFDRPTETVYAIGWSLQTYPSETEADAYSAVGDTSPSTGCASCQHNQAFLDSWGSKTQETLANAPGAAINLATTYDSNGRVASESHAYTTTSDPNYVFENYSYDGLDRSAGVAHPDSEYSSIFYGSLVAQYGGLSSQQGSTSTYGVGYPELLVDENGKKKQEWIDGFGQLIEVDEAVTTGTTSHGSFSICCTAPIQDVGTVYVTVGTFNTQVSYDESSTVNSVASDLASALNGSGVVTASASGSTVNMTSLATGTGANYSLSSYSEGQLNPPKFRARPSGSTMTGGTDGSSNSTFYTYDALGNLTSVVQGTQTPRTFTYDGLSRKTSESTPEAGTISIGYAGCSGDPSNPCSKTDARGITTTYVYDGLNRTKSKSYSNGQGSVTYTYDQGGASAFALGRLTQMVDPSGSETYTYDPDGDVLQLQKVAGSTTYTIGYQYNAGGELTQVTYPSGRVVAYSYDAVGRLCDVASTTGCTASNPYATSYAYDSAGHVTGITFGNGIVGTYNYFPKTKQLSSLSYAKTGSNLFSLNYWYQHDSTNCPSGTPDDDGPINCITDNVDSGRSVSYTYDADLPPNAAQWIIRRLSLVNS